MSPVLPVDRPLNTRIPDPMVRSFRASVLLGTCAFLSSVSGQVTWTQQNGAGEHLWAIDMANEQVGLAAGYEIRRTTDGGQTWQVLPDPLSGFITDIQFTSPQKAWMTGSRVLVSNDAGLTWETQGTSSLRAVEIHMVNDQQGWFAGFGPMYLGTVRHTSNGGQSWELRWSMDSTYISDIKFVDAQNGWLTDYYGRVMRTSDGGYTWTVQLNIPSIDLRAVAMVDAQNGWCAGGTDQCPSYARLFRTSNGGNTWTPVQLPASLGSVNDLAIHGAQEVWLACGSLCGSSLGGVHRTVDGGLTWFSDIVPNEVPRTAIDVRSGTAGWSSGHDGNIVHFSTASTGISEIPQEGLDLWWDAAADGLQVRAGDPSTPIDMRVMNALGQVIHQGRVRGPAFVPWTWAAASGPYLVRLDQGARTRSLRFIR